MNDNDTSRTLTRTSQNGMIGGICAGLAEYFDVDPTLVRAVFVAATVMSGFGVVLYLVLWIALDDVETTPRDDGSLVDAPLDAGPMTEIEIEAPLRVAPMAVDRIDSDQAPLPGDAADR